MTDYYSIAMRIIDDHPVTGWEIDEDDPRQNNGYIYIPTPDSRDNLQIVAHEVAHAVFNHSRRTVTPIWIQEREAEQWACDCLRRYGVEPNEYRADNYIADHRRWHEMWQALEDEEIDRQYEEYLAKTTSPAPEDRPARAAQESRAPGQANQQTPNQHPAIPPPAYPADPEQLFSQAKVHPAS